MSYGEHMDQTYNDLPVYDLTHAMFDTTIDRYEAQVIAHKLRKLRDILQEYPANDACIYSSSSNKFVDPVSFKRIIFAIDKHIENAENNSTVSQYLMQVCNVLWRHYNK